jgi:hypothetical protein
MMDELRRHLRGLAPILAIGLLAGCAQETVPPAQAAASLAPQAATGMAPHLASARRQVLFDTGVPAARIDTSWLGEGKPEVTTADDVAEPHNRAVDVTVVQVPR